MSNINIKSDMGGGNSLNLIRIPSLNEVNTIFSSDLNGSITPGNSNTWQYDYKVMMYQNNTNGLAYMNMIKNWIEHSFYDKSTTFIEFRDCTTSFHPVIEFRE